MDIMPRVKAVSAAKLPFVLNVEWNDGSKSRVDLTGLVHSSQHFKVFADDLDAFRKVQPDEYGVGIEWANGLDYSANTLKALADEQKPMSGKYLELFEKLLKLSTEETAHLMKVDRRTILNWRQSNKLPVAVGIAIRRFQSDPTAFAAHYRPIEAKPRGRPKQAHRER